MTRTLVGLTLLAAAGLLAGGGERGPGPGVPFARDGTVVWQLTNDDLPGRPLRFLGGFHRLADGTTVLSNRLGHGHIGDAPLVLAITPDRRVAWTYENHDALRTAASVVVLDAPARVPKSLLAH